MKCGSSDLLSDWGRVEPGVIIQGVGGGLLGKSFHCRARVHFKDGAHKIKQTTLVEDRIHFATCLSYTAKCPNFK
jgi:hypothetical protein